MTPASLQSALSMFEIESVSDGFVPVEIMVVKRTHLPQAYAVLTLVERRSHPCIEESLYCKAVTPLASRENGRIGCYNTINAHRKLPSGDGPVQSNLPYDVAEPCRRTSSK
jgi:hypothetical protein